MAMFDQQRQWVGTQFNAEQIVQNFRESAALAGPPQQLPPDIGDFTGRKQAVDQLVSALTQPTITPDTPQAS
jgi:hypothetical protein